MPQKRITLYQSLVPPPRQPDIRVFDQAIFQRWTEPPKPKIAPRLAIALIASGLFAPVLNPNTQITQNYESRWHQGWSEPVRQKPGLRSYLQDTGAPDVALPQPNAAAVVAPATLSTDVLYPRSFIYQSKTQPVLPIDILVVDKVFQPWSEPVRVKISLKTHLQDVGAPDVVLPPPVQVSQWNYAWSEPVRLRRLSSALQSTTTPPVTTPVAAAVTIVDTSDYGVIFSRSFIYQTQTKPVFPPTAVTPTFFNQTPWSEPTRRNGLAASQQQFLAWSTFTPAPPVTAIVTQTFTSDVIYPRSFIYQAKTQPVTTPAPATPTFFNLTQGDSGLIFQKSLVYQINTDPIGVTAPFTYLPWSEPVRRRGFPVTLQQTLAWQFVAPVAPSTDVVVPTTWAGPPDRNLLLQYQGSTAPVTVPAPVVTAIVPTTITSNVLFPRSFIYQSFTKPVFPPAAEIITVDKWFKAWQEPVRIKRGLRASEQQAYTAAPYFPNFNRLIQWFQPFSEPVREKKGLVARLQQFFAFGSPRITSTVTVVLDATETNGDIALFAVSVYNRPVRCVVSIREIKAIDGSVASIEEVPAINGAAASIEET